MPGTGAAYGRWPDRARASASDRDVSDRGVSDRARDSATAVDVCVMAMFTSPLAVGSVESVSGKAREC